MGLFGGSNSSGKYTCSQCKGAGHNRRSCGKSPYTMLPSTTAFPSPAPGASPSPAGVVSKGDNTIVDVYERWKREDEHIRSSSQRQQAIPTGSHVPPLSGVAGTLSLSLKSAAVHAATEATAAQLHERWRASRQLPDGTYDPRWKDDGQGGQVDIANTPYRELPPAWQAENKTAAESAIRAILENPEATMESLAATVHEDWLGRNGDWAPPEQKLPYEQLAEEEKEKDRVVVRAALTSLSFSSAR